MRILPLVLHAAARLPALTTLFSDTLAAASLSVVAGGKTTITTSAPHDYELNSYVGLSIVDADSPNVITEAHDQGDGNWLFVTTYAHDLSTAPAGTNLTNWNITARLAGFGDDHLNGLIQLVDVPSANSFVVKPPAEITSVPLSGSQVLLERLENGIVGWHKMQAVTATTLEFDTPSDVTRSYSVSSPRIATNIRVFGALTLETAKKQVTRGFLPNQGSQDATAITNAWLAITPPPSVSMSKDRMAQTDSVAEITPQSEYRQVLMDGFHVYVFLPAENSGGGVTCSDLASGEILSAVLRTFHGLVLPRRELAQADSFVSLMVEHGNALGDYDRATYVHGYVFQAPAFLQQLDAIQAFEWSRIGESTMTAASGVGPGTPGGVVDTATPIAPAGSVAFRGIEIGIRHDDAPQPLTATVDLP